jgi:pyruvate/2-oxoglutarate dehydrogenase complex dihydrolipoamide acyltransferase (E2) component
MAFDIRPFPTDRNLIVDTGYLASKRHIIHGFMELDVTDARRILKATSGSDGRPLSFTAFIIASFAQAIHTHPEVQAYRDIRRRLIVFHDVDVSTLVEPAPGKVAVTHTIRNAHMRSVRDISEEIRSVQSDPHPWGKLEKTVKIGSHMPRFARLLYMRIVMLNPMWIKQVGGTTIVTSYGMFGKRTGWGIGFLSLYTLGMGVAGIAEKPMAYEGTIALRECLHITLSFNHDVVDGAPAARFARTFAELIESGSTLEDEVSS